MKKNVRLYNVILPIWLLWLFPQVWLVVVPANLLVDCLVLVIALAVLKHQNKRQVVKRLWWKFWLLGFLADLAGALLLYGVMWIVIALGYYNDTVPACAWWYDQLSPVLYNAFQSPIAFLVTLLCVALAGLCIYLFDKAAMKKCDLLTALEKRRIALTMAIVTTPWLFFIPLYWS